MQVFYCERFLFYVVRNRILTIVASILIEFARIVALKKDNMQKFLKAGCVACGLLLHLSCGASESQCLSLAGDWEYLVRAADESLEPAPEAWDAAPTVVVPFDWTGHPDYQDFAGCLLLRRAVSSGEVRVLSGLRSPVAFDSGYIGDTATFYWKEPRTGLIGTVGSHEPYRTGYDGRLVATLPEGVRIQAGDYLYARVCSLPGRRLFLRGPEIVLGPADTIFRNYGSSVAIALVLGTFYLCIGGYHLLLALRRPRDIYNLYFGIFAFAFTGFHITNSAASPFLFHEHLELRSVLDQVSLMVFVAALLLFITRFFLGRHSRFAVAMAILYGIFAVAEFFLPLNGRDFLLRLLQLTMPAVLPYIFFVTGRAAWRGNTDARLLLLGVGVIVGATIHDILVDTGVLASTLIMPFAFLVFVLGIAVILANRFVHVHNEVEELNRDLEARVQQRTAELEDTLTEVRTLKERQDGDYFLTSQLLQPLAGNFSRQSGVVRADMRIRQKKRFRFRHREGEIGGDLCAVHSLQLRKRNVLVFFNGDAMGKSIQGAGGALIMGTVFKSVVARTEKNSGIQELHPEQWLHLCFQELRDLMLTFDGRMMVSVVVGIVDEASGVLYFVNAEHPGVVLLREGRAAFLPERGMLRKLGMEDPAQVFAIQTLRLQRDDVFVVGSDGRDDIQIGTDDAGHPIINDDEEAFLKDVAESRGELEALEQRIVSRGGLVDDLSLIAVYFREDGAELAPTVAPELLQALESATESRRNEDFDAVYEILSPLVERQPPQSVPEAAAMRLLLRALVRTRRYEAAAGLCVHYLEARPEDDEVLLWSAYSLARSYKPAEAIEAGERLYLRNPEHERNVRHLVDLHERYGDARRAEELRSVAAAR